MAPTKGSQQFFVVLLPKYVVVSPPQFLVVRLLQFLACCGAGLLAVNNRRLRTIFGQSVDSRHWSRLIYGITSDSSRFSRLLFFSKISFFCSPHLSTLIKEHIKASIYGLLKKFLYQSNKRIFLTWVLHYAATGWVQPYMCERWGKKLRQVYSWGKKWWIC